MMQQSGQAANSQGNGFSPQEETLLARAETALEELSLDYQAIVQNQFLEISGHVAAGRWLDASHIAHSICGEAGTFHRPTVAQVAVLLRDILLSPNPESLRPSIEVLQDGLSFFINPDRATTSETAHDLLEGLKTVAAKSGVEVTS